MRWAFLFLIFIIGCGSGGSDSKESSIKIDIGKTFYWQLSGEINTAQKADIYDIDLFDSSKTLINKLKSKGKIVICYFSAGSYEDWREDANKFPQEVIGEKMEGWNERWIDIRNKTIREIMKSRMDLAKNKGCDGVEVDNIDGYLNNTGFDLTYDDQLDYNIFLSNEAKKRGLLIALKNDVNQVKDLVNYFDFAIVEECIKYNECDKYIPFINQNKAVFDIEYDENSFNLGCSSDDKFKFYYAPLNLDGSFWRDCDDR